MTTLEQFTAQQDAKNSIQLNVTKWCYMLIDALKADYKRYSIRGHKRSMYLSDDNSAYHAKCIEELENDILPIDYEIVSGRKYHKIVLIDGSGSRSAHAFVDRKTGELYKFASWKAPAKGVRYDLRIIEQRDYVLQHCDWSGGYLYA